MGGTDSWEAMFKAAVNGDKIQYGILLINLSSYKGLDENNKNELFKYTCSNCGLDKCHVSSARLGAIGPVLYRLLNVRALKYKYNSIVNLTLQCPNYILHGICMEFIQNDPHCIHLRVFRQEFIHFLNDPLTLTFVCLYVNTMWHLCTYIC